MICPRTRSCGSPRPPEGEHVFLEVNPAGQFLWVEEANPELRLLATFVDFLLSRDPAFRWQPEADAIRHADYRRRALDRLAALGPVHVPVADKYISSDLPGQAAEK